LTYATRTKVAVEDTKFHIERLVTKYGAKGFVAGWQGSQARVEFLVQGRHIRLIMVVPDNAQAARSRWRALYLVVKAKLESVEAKISTFEQAFAADIVMPSGKTVWEEIREPIQLAYEGKPAPLLLGPNHLT
jgi:hypothetical protein